MNQNVLSCESGCVTTPDFICKRTCNIIRQAVLDGIQTSGLPEGNPKRLILLALNWERDKDPRTPLGHCSILSSLRAAKIDTISLVEQVDACDLQELCSRIFSYSHANAPADLAIGVYCWNDAIVKRLLPAVRRIGFKGRIILGGPQISFLDTGFKTVYPDADIFICGDGEEPLKRVMLEQGYIDMPGVHYGDLPTRTCQGICDLNILPSPWLCQDCRIDSGSNLRWETMRGCPYSCNFCQHRGKKAGVGYFPIERILAEIDLFCRQKVSSIAVLDPVFNINHEWAMTILKAFEERKFGGHISLQCRTELVTDEFLELVSRLNVTLEYGLQTIHKNECEAIKRENKITKVDNALCKTRVMGIKHEVSVIFGLPNQTQQSFGETVEWCLNREVPVIKAFPLMLLKGTELAQCANDWNLVESDTPIPWVKSSKTFNEKDWRKMNAISSALQRTENKHPKTLRELLDDDTEDYNFERWSPSSLNQQCPG
jgi:hypothetical protein